VSGRSLDELRNQHRDWSTEDLLRIVVESQDYRPEAVQVVREILVTRDPAELETFTEVVMAEQRQGEALAAELLSPFLRAICFVFCGIPGIVIAAYQESQRAPRLSSTTTRWRP